MNKVFSLEDARKIRKSKDTPEAISHIEEVMYNTLRKSCFHDWDAKTAMDKFFEGMEKLPDAGKLAVTALEGAQNHLLVAWVEILQQYLRYLKEIRYHLTSGRQDLIIEDGLACQGNDPFPEPMLITGFGTNPFDDKSVYASASLSARNMWFDGEIQNLEYGSVRYHPESETKDGEKHLVEIPHIMWKSGVDSCKRGMVNPLLVNSLLATFFLDGVASCGGINYKFENGRHRFSYLEVIGLSTIVEWSFVVHSEVYEIYGV